MELYKRIRMRREELGMSQEELAQKIGYKSRSSINKIEMGENDIPQSKISKFAEALETTEVYLMGWEDSPDLSLSEQSKSFMELVNQVFKKYGYNPIKGVATRKLTLDAAEFVDIYITLNEENQKKAKNYVNSLLAIQQTENEVLNAASERPNATEIDKKKTNSVMENDSEWE